MHCRNKRRPSLREIVQRKLKFQTPIAVPVNNEVELEQFVPVVVVDSEPVAPQPATPAVIGNHRDALLKFIMAVFAEEMTMHFTLTNQPILRHATRVAHMLIWTHKKKYNEDIKAEVLEVLKFFKHLLDESFSTC